MGELHLLRMKRDHTQAHLLPGRLRSGIPNSVGKQWDSQTVCCLIVSWLNLAHANRTGLQKMVQETLTGYQIPGSIQQMVK